MAGTTTDRQKIWRAWFVNFSFEVDNGISGSVNNKTVAEGASPLFTSGHKTRYKLVLTRF